MVGQEGDGQGAGNLARVGARGEGAAEADGDAQRGVEREVVEAIGHPELLAVVVERLGHGGGDWVQLLAAEAARRALHILDRVRVHDQEASNLQRPEVRGVEKVAGPGHASRDAGGVNPSDDDNLESEAAEGGTVAHEGNIDGKSWLARRPTCLDTSTVGGENKFGFVVRDAGEADLGGGLLKVGQSHAEIDNDGDAVDVVIVVNVEAGDGNAREDMELTGRIDKVDFKVLERADLVRRSVPLWKTNCCHTNTPAGRGIELGIARTRSRRDRIANDSNRAANELA